MKVVNQPLRKKDAMQFVTGQPVYVDDVTPRDCLCVKLLRSPHANAIVKSINKTAAMKVPGMEAIFTWEDVDQDGRRYTQAGQTYPEASPYDRLVIDRHVRFVGDVVAILAGADEKCVDKAMKLVKVEYEVLKAYHEALLAGRNARSVSFESKEEQAAARNLFLLTAKPVLYVCNVDEASAATGNAYVEAVRKAVEGEGADILVVAARTEADIAELETYEERQMFLQDVGLEESGCNRLIKAAYHLLNLETFITAGEMEVKAWTYHRGWKAPQCAGVIHTDFEKGFIRAEVIKYDDYIKYGSEAAVREAGLLHVEGKEYVVQDGDIMHFLFNV